MTTKQTNKQKAEAAALGIIASFESGTMPEAMALCFIHKKDNSPVNTWSWRNQMLVALAGYYDARGFAQWQAVNRSVTKGERSKCSILIPMIAKREDKDTGEETTGCYGFKAVPMFGLEQTNGEPLESQDRDLYAWIEALPLKSVADSWNISVQAYSGTENGAQGHYSPRPGRKSIALGVKNLSTWTHELCHAADDKTQGGLQGGQQINQEVVAELGGAILLEILGYNTESDTGGCYKYIKAYADRAKIKPLTAITNVLNRTCQAVALILETAEQIQTAEKTAVA